MMIHVEKKVMGSLNHKMGDGVLAYTQGVSRAAENLGAILAENARTDSASLYLFTHPDTGKLTVAHVQGGFTTFAGHGRSYATRAIYEVEPAVVTDRQCPLSCLVRSLDGMRSYDAPVYDDVPTMSVPDGTSEMLNDEETRLLQYITYCLAHRRQMFIRLGDDERLYGDGLQQSPRLLSLLRAINKLPAAIRPYVSLAYSVESTDKALQYLFNNMLIVCHHDDISLWGNARQDGILLDWTAPGLRSVNARRASVADIQRVREVAPMLRAFSNGQRPTLDNTFTLMSSIPYNIDRVLRKSRLDDNDKLILSSALQCGPESYRHEDVASRLNTPDEETPRDKRKKASDEDAEATIDRRWVERHGRKLIFGIIAITGLVLAGTFLKQFTQMGRSATSSVYIPSSDKGFVGKTNQMLARMVARGSTAPYDTIHPRTLADLERKYPGLKFALPYGDETIEGGRAADIRLSDIDPAAIEDEDDVRFFHNSDVPSLLTKQRQSLGERIFRISFADDGLTIKSIQLAPAMFKVALESNPWTGTIVAAENSMFPSSSHCFLTWGKSVVPIVASGEGHIATGGGFTKVVKTNVEKNELTLSSGKDIDFFQLYNSYGKDTTTIVLQLGNGKEIAFDYLEGHRLRVKPTNVYCAAFGTEGSTEAIRPLSSSEDGSVYPLEHSMKLVCSDNKDKNKITEMVINRENPMFTLSSLMHTHQGKSRYNITPNLTDKFTQQIVKGLSTTLHNSMGSDTIHLSIDPMLSKAMETEMTNYCKSILKPKYGRGEWEMSLTIMDMSTGCVVGAPYYRSSDEGIDYELALGRKNPALMRRYLGSSFKPLVALASVLTKPDLVKNQDTRGKYSLTSQDRGGRTPRGVAEFFGHTTQAWALGYTSFWGGCSSISEFLAKSDDVYPVAMVARALGYGEKAGSPFQFTKTNVLLKSSDTFTWPSCAFIQKLDKLYTLPSMKDYNANDSVQMTYYTWDALNLDAEDRFGLDNVSPDPTLLYYDNFNTPGATMKGELVPWILGQGTNEWNSLKIAEAWTRMITKRKVFASFVMRDNDWEAPLLSKDEDNTAWNGLLNALREAQGMAGYGLLSPMNREVENLCDDERLTGDNQLILLSKTGTPDNYKRQEVKRIDGKTMTLDMGLYCMALMSRASFNAALYGGKPQGLMCVIRVTRLVPGKVEGNGVQSSDARNFFSSSPARLKKFYHLTRNYY